MLVKIPEPFALKGADKLIPPGEYEVTTEEEPLGDMMEPGYRRIAASIYLPPPPGLMALGQIIELESGELDMLRARKI